MSKVKIIETPSAPKAVGPYSVATAFNDMLFLSGQIPLDPATGELVEGDFEALSRRVLDNISLALNDAGSSLDSVIKTTVFLSDMDNFVKFNKVYSEYFSVHKPARSCVAVKTLPKNVPVEVELIAALKG